MSTAVSSAVASAKTGVACGRRVSVIWCWTSAVRCRISGCVCPRGSRELHRDTRKQSLERDAAVFMSLAASPDLDSQCLACCQISALHVTQGGTPLRRKRHHFFWHNPIPDAHFSWLPERGRLLIQVFLGHAVNMGLCPLRSDIGDPAADLQVAVRILRVSKTHRDVGVTPHHTVLQTPLDGIDQYVGPIIVTPHRVD